MISAEDLSALIPAKLNPKLGELYSKALLAGMLAPRPKALQVEQQILHTLAKQIEQLESIEQKGLFTEAYDQGIEIRIEAERVAAQIYKACVGRLPGRIFRRLLAQKWRVKRALVALDVLQRQLVEHSYRERYGVELSKALEITFGGKFVATLKQLPLAKASASERIPLAGMDYSAQNLDLALREGKGPWAGRFFLGRTAQERAALVAEYRERFGELKLEKSLRGWELEFVTDLIQNGRVSWAKLLYLCVIGVGTDEQGLRELLEAMSPKEIQHAAEEFHKLWLSRASWYEKPLPHILGDLKRRIWLETGGDCWFDLQDYFASDLPFPQNLSARLEKLYQHELSGALIKRLDFVSREGLLMNHDVACMRDFYQHYIATAELDLARHLRFRALVCFAEFDCEVFRGFKHFIGNLISNLIAAASAASAGYALGVYKIEITLVMICVGTVSISSRIVLKNLFKGRGYHREELIADLFFGALDGATLFTAYIFRQALLNFGTRFLTKLGLKTGVSRLLVLMGGGRVSHLDLELSELGGGAES